jgi:hypothetical protein
MELFTLEELEQQVLVQTVAVVAARALLQMEAMLQAAQAEQVDLAVVVEECQYQETTVKVAQVFFTFITKEKNDNNNL